MAVKSEHGPWQAYRKPYIDERRVLERSYSPTNPRFWELDRQLRVAHGIEQERRGFKHE